MKLRLCVMVLWGVLTGASAASSTTPPGGEFSGSDVLSPTYQVTDGLRIQHFQDHLRVHKIVPSTGEIDDYDVFGFDIIVGKPKDSLPGGDMDFMTLRLSADMDLLVFASRIFTIHTFLGQGWSLQGHRSVPRLFP